ncbi:MAG: cytochrome c [Chloroflexi bacterium]|nr:cytochrome c [Chloroflexota bacterium]
MNLRTPEFMGSSRSRLTGRKRVLLALASVALLSIACVQDSGTYPIEIFTEMHYSPAFRSQEIPRLGGVESAVVYDGRGNAEDVANILPANIAHPYDAKAGAELYRVNCAACHGAQGLGDGPAALHITSTGSAFAEENGVPYNAPPNLQVSRTVLNEDGVFGIVTGGIIVMPRFGPLLSEAERWDIVRYIFDNSASGLGQ